MTVPPRPDDLADLGERLTRLTGVVAVHVTTGPAGGLDLVLYHRGPMPTATHAAICRSLTDPPTDNPCAHQETDTRLRIAGTTPRPRLQAVSAPPLLAWGYFDLDRLQQLEDRVAQGRHHFELPPGKARLQPDFQPLADLTRAHILADPSSELRRCQHRLQHYPDALSDALVARLWETALLLEETHHAADHGDTVGVAAGLARVLDLAAHALHGYARTWPPDPVELFAATRLLVNTPPGFTRTTQHLLAHLGSRPTMLHDAADATTELLRAITATCQPRRQR